MEWRVCLLLITCVMSVRGCKLSLLPSDTLVKCTKTEPAILGGNVTITCSLLQPGEVIQKTWCKRNGNDSKVVATDSAHGPKVNPEFSSYISLGSDHDHNTSSIEISKLEKEDEACYVCRFIIKHGDGVHGVICLTDIGTSNEFTCSAPGNLFDILMTPQETRSRKDDNESGAGSVQRKGYFNSNVRPTCTFYVSKDRKRARRSEKKEREVPDEKVLLQCSSSGREKPQIYWNNTGNAEDEHNTTTDGQIITSTSSIFLLVPSLFSNQNVSCSIISTSGGKQENIWIWAVLTIGVVAAAGAAIYYMCRRWKRSSQKNENKTSKDGIQPGNTEESSIVEIPENKDETPTKENDGLVTKASSYTPRKLFD